MVRTGFMLLTPAPQDLVTGGSPVSPALPPCRWSGWIEKPLDIPLLFLYNRQS